MYNIYDEDERLIDIDISHLCPYHVTWDTTLPMAILREP
jgi:hypothetical protein